MHTPCRCVPVKKRARQRGAALLLAMLVVALVAVLASAATWQQWRSSQVEAAERSRLQANWILVGALDWARLILTEDAKQGGADHLAEPWAIPLMEARLNTFLAAERNVTIDTSSLPDDAFISGRMDDMQGRLNLWNLVANSQLSVPDVAALQRLFATLGLPENQALQLAQAWRRSAVAWGQPESDPGAPPLPRQVQQLVWLGVPAHTVARISPYITILPQRTALNANTASAPVLAAAMPGASQADAQRIVTQRSNRPFVDMALLRQSIPAREGQIDIGISSNYFLVQGRLRVGNVSIQQQALVQRLGQQSRVVWREIGSFADEPAK